MKIIITGALGHIGSGLIRGIPFSLNKEVILIDSLITQRYSSLFNLPSKGKYKFYDNDVRDFDFDLILEEDDIIINLSAITDAAASFDNPKIVEKNNFKCTEVLAQACVRNKSKLITISSTSVYGSTKNIVDETASADDLNPQSPYAHTKLREEELVQKLSRENNLKSVILRFGTIYGSSPGMRFHTAVNKFCWQAVHGKPITVWETAYEQKRPYLNLDDAIKSLIFFIENNIFDSEIYNVLSGNHSVKEVVESIKKYIPNLEINFVKNEIMNQLSYEVSVDKLLKKGFRFSGNIDHGISETISLIKASNSI